MTYQEAISRGYIKIVTKPLASQSEAEAVASHKKRGGADVVVVRSIVDGKSGGWIPMSKGGLDGAEMSSLRDRIALAAVKRELGTQDDVNRAYMLWKRYRTQEPEYKEIAKRMGITVSDLNSRMHDENKERA